MKIKLSKFWCLALTLIVVLSLGLVFAAPAGAVPSTSPTVTIIYPTDGGTVGYDFGKTGKIINGTASAVTPYTVSSVKVQISYTVPVVSGKEGVTTITWYWNGSGWDNVNTDWFTATGTTTWTDTSGITAAALSTSYTYQVEADVLDSNQGSGQALVGFTYVVLPAPTVTSIAPSAGPSAGGTAVTITGTNFISGATVTIGAAATNVVFVSATSITAKTAAGTDNTSVNVVVTNPDTQVSNTNIQYIYDSTNPIVVRIDKLMPHTSLVVPEAGTADNFPQSQSTPYLNGPSVVSGDAKDMSPGSVTTITLTITSNETPAYNSGPLTAVIQSEAAQDTTPGYNWKEWTYTIPDGISTVIFPANHSKDGVTYTISAQATDEAGNKSAVVSKSFILDTTPPTVVFTAPILPANGSGIVYNYITGTASDPGTTTGPGAGLPGSGIEQWGAVYKDLDPTQVTYNREGDSDDLANIQWLYQAYGRDRFSDGQTYTLTIYVVDEAGNVGTATSNTFTFKRLHDDDMMYLSEGWNFISVPAALSTDANTFGAIFTAQGIPVTMAYGYDPSQTSPWGTGLTASSIIKVLDGYWIKIDIYRAEHVNQGYDFVDQGGHRVDYVKVYFSYADATQTVPPTKTVYANGWNAIGVSSSTPIKYWQPSPYDYLPYFDGCQLLVQDQLSSIMDGWSVLIGFNRYQQKYVSSVFNNDSLKFGGPKLMLPGSGYWIFINKDTNDVYSAVSNGIQSGGGGPP